jgi:SAM-dependent methyltransferase
VIDLKSPLRRGLVRVRRRYYADGTGRRGVAKLPARLRRRLQLDDDSAVGSHRIEVGGGPYALPGHLHVDVDPRSGHLEAVAPAWSLPFPDAWAIEIVAIHALEHVPPPRLVDTLVEWRRVLRPGGRARVHVPNGPELMAALVDAPVERKWPIMGSILGMYCGPDLRDPRRLDVRSDHQLIFDLPLLRWAFEQAGFDDVQDLTETATDRHVEAWRGVVPHYSLVVEARR